MCLYFGYCIFIHMKKKHFFYYIILTFLCLEIGWFYHIYSLEKKDFQKKTNVIILAAIKEINETCRKKTLDYFMDLRQKNRVIIVYSLHGSHFRKDTLKEEVHTLSNRLSYDFRNENWCLDSLAFYFQLLYSHSDLPIYFIRKDSEGQIIDQYPHPTTKRYTFLSHQLGNIDAHYLSAYYPFPFSYFWERQKYGLMISLIPFLFVLYYCFLLIKHRSREQMNNHFIEEQTIFIHDLKTPLCTNRDIENRILRNLTCWSMEKIHEKLEITYRQSCHILNDIKELMLRSIMFWGSEFQNQNFNLKKAIEELITYQQADHENVRITLDFRLSRPFIYGDPFHITHILGNLISNAIKYGGENINISVTCPAESEKQLLFSVQDDGPGIPSHRLKHIFRTGYQSPPHNQESHGLGLAYVRKIVRQYGGTIKVDSQPDKGTIFRITIYPEKKLNRPPFTFSAGIYYKIFVVLLLTESIWIYSLYSAERKAFVNQQTEFMKKAEKQVSKKSLYWQDTIRFENDTINRQVIITRGKQTAIVPLSGLYSDRNIYECLLYDLRGDKWKLDSIYQNYRQISHNTLPVLFNQMDSAGHSMQSYPANAPKIHFPVVSEIPLGYIGKHRLQAEYAFPWALPLKNHRVWLLFALTSTLLAGWLTYSLSVLAYRQKEISRFQREVLQHFIRNLQTSILGLLNTEEEALQYQNTQQIYPRLTANTGIFNKILTDVNRLLDQLVTIRNHRPIFD